MLVNISPETKDCDATKNSLGFGLEVKEVRLKK
jgi:hypothetical protein